MIEPSVLTHISNPAHRRTYDTLLTSPFTRDELVSKIKLTNKSSAPGPSGISYADLCSGPSITFLLDLFNTILRTGLVPNFWKFSKLTLIYKSGDKTLPSSWRPIAGQETMEKLFSGLLADRLSTYSKHHKLLPEWQRATAGSDGCHECNLVLDLARDTAKARHTQIHMVWVDIHNAFGSVNRDLLSSILARFGLPTTFISLIKSLYQNNKQLYDDAVSIRAIPERVGVKQGDPLSAILFSFYLAPAMFAVSNIKKGFKFDQNIEIGITAFADDSLLIAPTAENMRLQLNEMKGALMELGLAINARKCRSLSLTYVRGARQLADRFSLDEETIAQVEEHSKIIYLGKPIDSQYYTDIEDYGREALTLGNAIADSSLKPNFKLDALRVFVYSKFHFLMRIGNFRWVDLSELDIEMKAIIRRACELPNCTPNSYIEGPASCGCLGFPSLPNWQYAHTIAQFVSTMNNPDSIVGRIGIKCFKDTLNRASLCEAVQLLQTTANRIKGSSLPFGTTHWNPVLRAIKALNFLMEFRLYALDEVVDVRVGLKGSELHSLPADQLFHNLCLTILRVTFSEILKSPRQHVFRALIANRASSHSIGSAWDLSPLEWKFMHKCRLNIAYLPSRWHPGMPPGACHSCHMSSESLHHILSLCDARANLTKERHDCLQWRLVRAILSSIFLSPDESLNLHSQVPTDFSVEKRLVLEIRPGEKLYVNSRLPFWDSLKRPDILYKNDNRKFSLIVDVSVNAEDTPHAFDLARRERIEKYEPLKRILEQDDFQVHLSVFCMGAFGSFDAENLGLLRVLNLPPLHTEYLIRHLCSRMIHYASQMYYSYLEST